MASGRMIQRKIAVNKQLPRLAQLVDERMGAPNGAYAIVLFCFCIPHLDVNGRMAGDPVILKGQVVPRLPGIPESVIYEYLCAMDELELVVFYEADDDLWLYFPGFDRSQPGLRREREQPSGAPQHDGASRPARAGHPPAGSRQDAGSDPAEVEVQEEDQGNGLTASARAYARSDRMDAWGRGVFERLWLEVVRKAPSGNSLVISEAMSLCERSPIAADRHPAAKAEAFIKAFVDQIAAWAPLKGRCPAPTVEKFVQHFARCELIVDGNPPATVEDFFRPPPGPIDIAELPSPKEPPK